MADLKISQLPAASTPLGGTEVLPLVQSGETKKVTVSELRATAVTGVTATAPVVSSGGLTPNISMAAASTSTNGYLTSTDWNTFNSKQPAGAVTSVSGTTGRITSTGGTTPVIDLASGVATPGTTGSALLVPIVTVDTYGRVTGISTAANPQGTVTSVTGTAPVVSSGGATPAISMAAATTSASGYLTSTDWNTFNGKYSVGGALGTPSSATLTNATGLPLTTGVTGLLPVANGGTGTATPALVAGSNVTITGTWPNQTINSSGGTGTVTSVATGTGLTGGPITTSGTIALANTAVTAGTYTAANITVDAQGRITAAANGSGGGGGTVTSVAATVPSFLSVTGSPITTAGTLAISYSGTALPVANGGTGVTTSTGTGNVVLSTSPTLVTPILGTPTSGTLTNTTGLPLTTGVTGLLPVANGGTGTATPALVAGTNVTITGTWPNQTINSSGGAGGVTTFSAGTTGFTPNTATSGAVTLAGTLNVANGGTGVTTSTGSGNNVLSTSPTLVTPILGTPTSVTLTNATGLPLSTGVTGTLATTNGGTGLTSFTANGLVYASSTSALATGASLYFDGSNFGVLAGSVTTAAAKIHAVGNIRSSNGAGTIYSSLASDGVYSTGTDLYLFAPTGYANIFYANNSEQMRLTSTGLGIGTSSPYSKLDLAWSSSTGINNGLFGTVTNAAGANNGYRIGLKTSAGTQNWAAIDQAFNNLGTDARTYIAFSTTNSSNTTSEVMRLDGSGNLTVPAIYTNTTAAVTYVAVSSAGLLQRGGVSALKYKQDVRDLEEINVDQIRAVRYKSKCENDDQTKDHFGVIADEVDAVGIKELVTYGTNGEVEGFQYERLTVVLLKEIQSLRKRLTALEQA